MSTKSNIDLNIFSLYFCCTLGGCLFLFGKCGLLNALISFIAGIISFILCYGILNSKIKDTKVFQFLLVIVTVLTLVYTFCEFAKFTAKQILIFTPHFAIIFLFVLIIAVFTRSKKQAFLKFSLLSAFIILVFCLIIFIAGLSNFSPHNSKCLPAISLKEILRNYFIIFFPSVIPAANVKNSRFSGILGLLAAGIIFILFSTFTIFTFGYLNEKINYPILALCDTVNIGRIFTRLGYLFYFVIYVCGLIRTVICLKTIRNIYVPCN